jgi:sRNA-binding protein
MRRSKSGQRQKVEQSRAIVAQALGDAARRDQPRAERYVHMSKHADPVEVKSEAIGVLTIGEAATRLGIGTSEMEAMVKNETVQSLMAGWTVVVPTSEVESLRPMIR